MHHHHANTSRTIPAGPPPDTRARLARLEHARALVIAEFGPGVLLDLDREGQRSDAVASNSYRLDDA